MTLLFLIPLGNKLHRHFQILLNNILKRNNLFILGAGVSINYTNTIIKAKEKIKKDIHHSGSWMLEENKEKSELAQTLTIFSNENECDDIDKFYEKNTTNNAFRNLYLRNIITKNIPDKCPEYEFFNLCSGTIFNFNHDGLDEIFISRKHICLLHPHNKFPSYAREYLYALKPIEYDYKLALLDQWNIHPPIKEDNNIIYTEPYLQIKSNFEKFNEIFIIGYSFSELSPGKINDIHSFNFIFELAKKHKKRIWIINPNPEGLIALINIQNRNNLNNIVPIKWDSFTKYFLNKISFYPTILFEKGHQIVNLIRNNHKISSNTPKSWLNFAIDYFTSPKKYYLHWDKAYKEFYFRYKNFQKKN